MASLMEITQLCRLCLVKDQVNIPIFEEPGDIRQIFLKISACLPVKVAREDNLPKKICDGCSYKLEMFYEFWNTSASSEKQLLKWLEQVGIDKLPTSSDKSAQPQSHSINTDGVVLKQEVLDLGETHGDDDELPTDDLNVPTDPEYLLQQQSYQSFEFQTDGFNEGETASAAGPSSTITSGAAASAAPKRKRRAAAMKPLPPQNDSEDEDDTGLIEPKIAKTEEQSDDSAGEDHEPTTFVGLPDDNEQPGPSGVGKAATSSDAPSSFVTFGHLAVYFAHIPPKNIEIIEEEEANSTTDQEQPSIDSTKSEDLEEIENNETCLEEDDASDRDITITEELDEDAEEIVEENEEGEQYETEPENHVSNNKENKEKPPRSSKKCRVCHYCGKVISNILVHLRRCHGNYKCEECKQLFRTEKELENHMVLHGNNEFPCEICSLSFNRAFDYAVHYREHSGLKNYKCPICGFETSLRASVNVHIKQHENKFKYYCEICGKGFFSQAVHKEHVEAHSGVKRYKCEICNKSFLYNRYLQVHRKLNHKKILEGVEEINECHVCYRRFSFTKSLVRHLSKIHGIGKDVSVDCPICLKKISNPYNLKMHMRIHTGEKPFACESCGKTFSKRNYLKKHHVAIHS